MKLLFSVLPRSAHIYCEVPYCGEALYGEMHEQHTPIHYTVLLQRGTWILWHTYIVKFLAVEMDCDLMCRDFTLNAPLHLAAKYGHTGIVKFLTLQINCVEVLTILLLYF